ncbi:MAG: VOC family protein [Candidatus Eremiobacteraeota bacterium]|nr:VOC family protein [Candidatus Eremiobacteraeota bacterium]MBV9973564.1 VOC family protein [Candidatus Eremiobacteraeota bacterium]
MVKEIGFVVYTVSDLEKAKAFYRDVVGLGEPKDLHASWSEFDVGGTTFAVVTGGEAIGMPAGSSFGVAFEVDDLDATYKRLKESGVDVDEPFESPTCNACFVKDPDGNRFAMHQLKK